MDRLDKHRTSINNKPVHLKRLEISRLYKRVDRLDRQENFFI